MIVNVTVRVHWVERPTMPLPNGAKTAAEMMRSALFGEMALSPPQPTPTTRSSCGSSRGSRSRNYGGGHRGRGGRYRLERALLKPDKVEAMYRGEMPPPVVVAREGFAEMQRLQNRRAWARRQLLRGSLKWRCCMEKSD